jgi:hypothetical protein
MTFKLSNYLTEELNIKQENLIYQTSELLTALLPILEQRESYEKCAEIVRILKIRENLKIK